MLYKLNYKYQYIYKNIFRDKYKYANIVKNYKNYLKKIKKLKFYIIKFKENSTIKFKLYLCNYTIKKNNWWLIIIYF